MEFLKIKLSKDRLIGILICYKNIFLGVKNERALENTQCTGIYQANKYSHEETNKKKQNKTNKSTKTGCTCTYT